MNMSDEFEFISKIGEGSFGEVYRAKHNSSNEMVAIKIRKCETAAQYLTAYRHETSLLREIDHKNIIKMHKSYSLKNSANRFYLYIVYDLSDLDLHDYIYKIHKQKLISPDVACLFLSQILCGLAYLKEKTILHRDIKPGNILITLQTNTLTICDFGLARRFIPIGKPFCEPFRGSKDEPAGSDWYHAPEMMVDGCLYHYSVDVWAAGCVLGEMLTGDRVFHRRHGNADELTQISDCLGYFYEQRKESYPLTQEEQNGDKREEVYVIRPCAVLEGKSLQDRFKDVMEPDALDLLVVLLTFDPADRISADQALNHPFLTVGSEIVCDSSF